MYSAFIHNNYLLRRQVFALAGKFRVYDPSQNLVLFSEQKMFRLREDIRVYSDESKSQEVLTIKARQIIDFSAAYDVMDSMTGEKVGALRRKGWRSLLRDEWEALDASDQVRGLLFEDSMGLALLRRFLLGSLLPQNYDMTLGRRASPTSVSASTSSATNSISISAWTLRGCWIVVSASRRGFCWQRLRESRAIKFSPVSVIARAIFPKQSPPVARRLLRTPALAGGARDERSQ